MQFNKKNIIGILLLSTAVLLAAGTFVGYKTGRLTKSPEYSYTLVSHNVASIQNNPIEYKSVLESLTTKSGGGGPVLRRAAKKLLSIDTNKKSYGYVHRAETLKRRLEKVLASAYKTLGKRVDRKKRKRISALINVFLSRSFKEKKKDSVKIFLGAGKFSGLDKMMREMGIIRFSPLFFSTKMQNFFSRKRSKNFPESLFVKSWCDALSPYLPALYARALQEDGDKRRFWTNFFNVFLFDMHVTQRLYSCRGGRAWVVLSKKLQNSILGDMKKRNRSLIAMYKKEDAAIICLQECDSALAKALCKQGYFTPVPIDDKGAERSFIFYKKSVFKKKAVTPIRLKRRSILHHQTKDISSKGLKRLQQDREVVIHRVDQNDMIFLVASFHATSRGDNTETFLRAIFELKEKLEKKEGKRVLLLIGMDGNTSNDPDMIKSKMKKSYIEILSMVRRFEDVDIVEYDGKDISTVHKERSSFQVQIEKSHVVNKGISDFIIFSSHVTCGRKVYRLRIQGKYLSPLGPSLEENPSDHKMLAFSFSVRK